MKALRILAIASLGALLVGGCVPRFKSIESMESSKTPDSKNPGQGDKYAFGGSADSTGGTQADTSRATSKPKFGGS